MSGVVGDMLSHRAEALDVPDLDVEALMARGERRVRRHRLAAVTGTAVAVVLAVGVPSLLIDMGAENARRSDTPTAGAEAPLPGQLVWATGETIHYGNRTLAAGSDVTELDVTDDGIAFRTDDGNTWFFDGSTTDRIGTSSSTPGGSVMSDGSLLAWPATGGNGQKREIVVYDTRARQVVARVAPSFGPGGPIPGGFAEVDSVQGESVYLITYEPGPGENAPRERLFRYSVTTRELAGVARRAQERAQEAGLRGRPRTLVVGDSADTGTVTDGYGQHFLLVGSRLVATGEGGDDRVPVFDGVTGKRLSLRAPAGYGPGDDLEMFQWLDDDRMALFATRDTPEQKFELLVCRLSDRTCKTSVPSKAIPTRPVLPHVADPGGE